jgi:enoyl-CoA hydratase/carnithine racemase
VEEVLLKQRREPVCTLVLNRPEKRNSLSQDLIVALYETFQQLSKDDSIRTVVLRGAGDKAFCSGYDIASLPTNVNPEIQEKLRDRAPMELAFESIINYPYPVIAVMQGAAYGGGYELALCCDMRVGAKGLRIGMPPARLGLVYHWRGLQRFVQIIGLQRTREMLFTGDTYEGAQVLEMGLVDYLVSKEELEPFTHNLAETMASNAPLSLKGTKRILNLLLWSQDLTEQDAAEAQALVIEALNSEDLREGQLAFLQKRPPQFEGR